MDSPTSDELDAMEPQVRSALIELYSHCYTQDRPLLDVVASHIRDLALDNAILERAIDVPVRCEDCVLNDTACDSNGRQCTVTIRDHLRAHPERMEVGG